MAKPPNLLGSLPSVDEVVSSLGDQPSFDRRYLVMLARQEIGVARSRVRAGETVSRVDILEAVERAVAGLIRPRLTPLINATGVILHTNLGRAPVSNTCARAMADAAGNAVALEIDPETGKRGGRMAEISRLMQVLTSAEATLVVNNNVAAVLLVIAALGSGREVLVSRGEAVEIGGGFRVPDVVAQSGARLVDVGTTNKTYVLDFERAITPQTAVILRVHPSNFSIEGFAAAPETRHLATLCRSRPVPFVFDAGSGALVDTGQFGLRAEPTIGQLIADGVDVVTASGDKLLGGPQAGIICGRRDLVERAAAHPLARAVRADKATLAGVAATLRHYVAGDHLQRIPVWSMISAPLQDLVVRAKRISSLTGTLMAETQATVGGGSLPGETLRSIAIVASATEPDELSTRLRTGTASIYGRVNDGRLLLDLRTVRPEQDDQLIAALISALGTDETS